MTFDLDMWPCGHMKFFMLYLCIKFVHCLTLHEREIEKSKKCILNVYAWSQMTLTLICDLWPREHIKVFMMYLCIKFGHCWTLHEREIEKPKRLTKRLTKRLPVLKRHIRTHAHWHDDKIPFWFLRIKIEKKLKNWRRKKKIKMKIWENKIKTKN